MIVTQDDYVWHCALEPIDTYMIVAPLSDYAVLEPFKIRKFYIGREYSIPFENIKMYTTTEPAILYHVYGGFETYRDRKMALHKLNQIRLCYGKDNVCLANCTVPMESLYIDYDGILLSDNIIVREILNKK